MQNGRLPRIGLLAEDGMRIMGIRSVLRDQEEFDLIMVSGPDDHLCAPLGFVLVDSSTTNELFLLLRAFREQRPGTRLLVLGQETGLPYVERVIGAGAKGYLTHAASEQELRTALQVVMEGSLWAPRRVLSHLLESRLRTVEEHVEVHFTKRELEVLSLLVLGQPNRQIASRLGVDESTVKAHMGRLMRKAGVDNRTALSMRALERRWATKVVSHQKLLK